MVMLGKLRQEIENERIINFLYKYFTCQFPHNTIRYGIVGCGVLRIYKCE